MPATEKISVKARPTVKASPVTKKTKATPVKTKPQVTSAPATVVETVVETVQSDKKTVRPRVKVSAKATDSTPVEQEGEKPKVKRQRPRQRSWDELVQLLDEEIQTAYKAFQNTVKLYKSLKAAHRREVSHSRNRESTSRTPTSSLDQALVDYFRSRLEVDDFKINRTVTGGNKEVVDLRDLDVETRLHRTDVTQLYNNVFARHQLKNPEDGREVLYQKDQDLVSLLTTGVTNPALAEDVQAIKDGTYKLTIFNIQKFTSQYIHKARVVPTEETEEEETE
jgi:hypothetical protein